MQSYEPIDLPSPLLGMILFTNHEFILISPEPCFIGKRAEIYKIAIRLQQSILSIKNCISRDYQNDVRNEPAAILCFQEYVRQPTATKFFTNVACFQRKAVKDWNVHGNEVTMSYNIGICRTKGGFIQRSSFSYPRNVAKIWSSKIYKDNKTWALQQFDKLCRLFCFGIGRQSKIAWPL